MSNPYKTIPIFDELARGQAAVQIADLLAALNSAATAGSNVVVVQDYSLQPQPGDATGTYWVSTALYPTYACQLWLNGQRLTRVLSSDINVTSGTGNYAQGTWVNGGGTTVSRFQLGSAPVPNNNGIIDLTLTVTNGVLSTPLTSPTGLPIASATVWGVIRVGPTLRISPDGTLDTQSPNGLNNQATSVITPLIYGLGGVNIPAASNTQLTLLVNSLTQSFDTRQELVRNTTANTNQFQLKLATQYLMEWVLTSDSVGTGGTISLNAVLNLNTPQVVKLTLNKAVVAGTSAASIGYGSAIIDNRLAPNLTLGTSLTITTANPGTTGAAVLNATSFIKFTPIF